VSDDERTAKMLAWSFFLSGVSIGFSIAVAIYEFIKQ
jgi:hypothetical protein